jgi:Raf kinase inhibitor-like YbhB/YbcL family protein
VPTPTPTPSPLFAMTSSAFDAGGAIPRRFSCDGADGSPELAWTGVPDGTASLALLVDDPDARDFAHWIVYAMPASTAHLAEGAGAAGARLAQGTNDFGRVGYGGPCPPSGTHHYRFTLYALAKPLALSGAPRAGAVRSALDRATILGEVTLTATYRR